jgi:hypothetical protein
LGGGSGQVGAVGNAHNAAEFGLANAILLGEGGEIWGASLGALPLAGLALGLHKVVHGFPQFVFGGAQLGGGSGQIRAFRALVGNP